MAKENRCIYEDSFTGICLNADCPMRADECPIPDNIPGVCRYEKRETEPEGSEAVERIERT